MKSLLLTIGRAAVSIRNRRAESWEWRGRRYSFREAAPQRRRRPMLQQRDLFRRQRGRVLENYGERVVDGDHGVLGAVVVLHGGSALSQQCLRARCASESSCATLAVLLTTRAAVSTRRSCAAALELLYHFGRAAGCFGQRVECLARVLPYRDVEIA